MKHQFDRKIFTAKIFFNDIFFLLGHIPKIVRAFRNKKISKAFMEKIMTVSTAVNGCVYCEWFHAKQAVTSGITEEEIKQIQSTPEGREKLNKTYEDQQEMLSRMKKNVATAVIVATQATATKEYNDASSSSFKSKKSVYDSIPSTRSAGVMSRVSTPETFKNGVVNMARTMDASSGQITKLLKMDANLLEELYYDKPFLFDLYFEYSLYDDFGSSHEDSGINKLIESYEYKFGVTL